MDKNKNLGSYNTPPRKPQPQGQPSTARPIGSTSSLSRMTKEQNIQKSKQDSSMPKTKTTEKKKDYITSMNIVKRRRFIRSIILFILIIGAVYGIMNYLDAEAATLETAIETQWKEESKKEQDKIVQLKLKESSGGSVIMPDLMYLGTKKYSTLTYTFEVEEYLHKPTNMEFIFLPGGSFTMGTENVWKQRFDHCMPSRVVKVPPFLIAKYACTQFTWKNIMGTEPWRKETGYLKKYFVPQSNTKAGVLYPVSYISWEDCKEFCKKTGLSLPTEAQWEYACRGGSAADYCYGNAHETFEQYAWFTENAQAKEELYPHTIGQKKSNAYGLYDMYGNISEWCEDIWVNNYRNAPIDGRARLSPRSDEKVHRGGDYTISATEGQSAHNRFYAHKDTKSAFIGVRFCLALSKAALQYYEELQQIEQDKIEKQKAQKEEQERLERLKAKKKAEEEKKAEQEALRKAEEEKLAQIKQEEKATPIDKKALETKILSLGFKPTSPYRSSKTKEPIPQYIHNATKMKFSLILGGTFMMGSSQESTSSPTHIVQVPSFLIADTPCTQSTWRRVMKTTPWKGKSNVKEGKNYPATYISWNDAKKFAKKTKLQLPTEAQWEYACRAGSAENYSFGNNAKDLKTYAWFNENSWNVNKQYPQEVRKLKANDNGLYDMHGNIWEWCEDAWTADYTKIPTDGSAYTSSANTRAYRGGSAINDAYSCRTASRGYRLMKDKHYTIGVRFALTLP